MSGVCAVEDCDREAQYKSLCKQHYDRLRRHGSVSGGGPSRGKTLKFLESAVQHEGDECLIWPFARTNGKYGTIFLNGSRRLVHREVLIRTQGEPPFTKADARHLCGNGHLGCVNPKHLAWGTRRENMMDRVEHGTSSRGRNNGMAKLSEVDVIDIRRCLARGESQMSIAKKFGVSQATVTKINTGVIWSWLDEAAN